MNENLKIEVSTTINAPAFKVWNVLTNPDEVKKYFFGTQMESSLKVGEPIVFKGEWNGQSYEDKGVILEIVENHLLKYTYFSNLSGMEDKPENYANIEYRLDEQEGNTILTITQDGLKSEQSKIDSENNWKFLLDSIKKLVESN